MWNALPGFRSESSHKTWIYRITVNTCLQYIRKSKGKNKVSLEKADTVTDNGDNNEERAEGLMRAIGQLENVDRLIIMMVLIGGGLVSFWGPVLGVILYFLARDVIGGITETWLLWFGLMFMVLVMVRPEGLAGLLHILRQRIRPTTARSVAAKAGGA